MNWRSNARRCATYVCACSTRYDNYDYDYDHVDLDVNQYNHHYYHVTVVNNIIHDDYAYNDHVN